MKNNRALKSIIFVIALAVVCTIVFFLYYRITGKTNPLSNIFKTETKNSVFDNYNGFYVYSEDLGESHNIYNGCIVSNIDYQILVINNEFKIYKESCIGTYLVGSGKTSDLEFKEDTENKILYFEYEGNRYNKKNEINSVVLGNSFIKNTNKLDMSGYKFLVKQSETKDNYYNFEKFNIDGASSYTFNFYANEDGEFSLKLSGANKKTLYESSAYYDVDEMPDIYPFGKIIAVVELNKIGKSYHYDFNAYNESSNIYSIYDYFPIEVNGYKLTENDNFYITYDKSSRKFLILIAPANSNLKNLFCEDGNDSKDIAYYVFSLKYDYSKVNFTIPQYEKIGYVYEGCDYVNSIIGG